MWWIRWARPFFLLSFCYCLGDQRGTAECRAGLNKERNVGIVFFDIVGLEQVVHGLAGMLNADMVFGQDMLSSFGIFMAWVIQNSLEVFMIRLFQIGYGGDQCLGRMDIQMPTILAKSLILLARPARLERAAYGFEVRRSIQLSYGRSKLMG
jgi:hypothetical protein